MRTIWCAGAASMAAVALWLLRPDAGWLLCVRLADGEAPMSSSSRPVLRPRTIALLVAGVFVLVVPSGPAQVGVLAMGLAAASGLAMLESARARSRAREFKAESGRFLRSLSAELRAGVAPIDAAHAAADECELGRSDGVWTPVRRAGPSDLADALAAVATHPGGAGLADATAAWRVADQAGAPLAAVLGRVADAVQADVDVERDAAVEAAPARATARLMAVLPAAGVGLGLMMGVDPLGILFGTAPGVACLSAGLALSCAGLWWIERLVAAAES